MAPSANFVDLCRICATETQSIVRHFIFEGEGKLRDLSKKIAACLPVKVKEDDRLPKVLCGECVYKLDLLHEFREKSQKTEAYLFTLIDGPASDHHVRKQSSSQLRGAEEEDDDDSHGGGDNDGGHDIDDDDDELEPVTPAPVRRNAQGQICEPEVVIKVEEDNSKGDAAAASAASATPSAAAGTEDGGSPSKRPRRAAANKRPIREDSPSLEAPSSPPPPKRRGRKPKGVTPTSTAAATSTATPGTSTSGEENITPASLDTDAAIVDNSFSTHKTLDIAKAMEIHSEHAPNHSEEDIATETRSSGSENISTLKLMMDAHFGDPYANITTNYQCAGCPKVFKGFKNYKTHFDASHQHISNVCKTCYVMFTNENTLREHVLELGLLCSVKIVHQGDEIEASNTNTAPPNLVVGANEVIETQEVNNELEIVEKISDTRENDGTEGVGFEFINLEKSRVSEDPKVVVVHTLGNTQFHIKKIDDKLEGAHNRRVIELNPISIENETKENSSGITNVIFPIEITGELPDESTEGNVVVISGFNDVTDMIEQETKESIAEVTISHLIPASPTYNTQAKPFKCKSCPASFASSRSLGSHRRLHSGIFYACDKCDQKFIRANTFEAHKRSHLMGKKVFLCSTCGSSFTRRKTLQDHEIKHGTQHECDECKRPFATEELLAKHVAKQHRAISSERFECSMCVMQFTSFNLVKRHIREVHIENRPFSCSKCDRKFLSENSMLKHQLTHDVVNKISKFCEICNKKFNIAVYDSHYIRHHVPDAPKCLYCRKAFESEEARDEHVQSHSKDLIGKKTHACPICDYLFCSEGFLVKHMKKLHPNEQNYQCTLCDKMFQTPTQCQMHKLTHSISNYSCPHCEMSFKSIMTLRRHVTTKHTTKDSKPCPLCDNVFSHLDDFNLHYRKEHKTKICRKCRQIFNTVEELIAHCKEVHSQFMCPICNKWFHSDELREKHLKAHEQQHFVCDYCKMGYCLKVSLLKHIMMKHFPNSTKCKLCTKIFASDEELEAHMSHHENDARTFFISKIQSFACNVCGEEFETQELFTEHEKKHVKHKK